MNDLTMFDLILRKNKNLNDDKKNTFKNLLWDDCYWFQVWTTLVMSAPNFRNFHMLEKNLTPDPFAFARCSQIPVKHLGVNYWVTLKIYSIFIFRWHYECLVLINFVNKNSFWFYCSISACKIQICVFFVDSNIED